MIMDAVLHRATREEEDARGRRECLHNPCLAALQGGELIFFVA